MKARYIKAMISESLYYIYLSIVSMGVQGTQGKRDMPRREWICVVIDGRIGG